MKRGIIVTTGLLACYLISYYSLKWTNHISIMVWVDKGYYGSVAMIGFKEEWNRVLYYGYSLPSYIECKIAIWMHNASTTQKIPTRVQFYIAKSATPSVGGHEIDWP